LCPEAAAADSMAALPPRTIRSARETWRLAFWLALLKESLIELSWIRG
jgi:hypothetical protein